MRLDHLLHGALALLSVTLLAACSVLPARPETGGFVERRLDAGEGGRRYQVFVPSRHAGGGRPPVVLFLHGSGERGDDGDAPTRAGLGPYLRAHADDFPAIVVFPQVPEGGEWTGDSVAMAFAALDAATAEFDGDRSRTYLTGMSMGGYGTWELALAQPRRFAALVPVCGAVRAPARRPSMRVTAVADEADPFAAVAARLHPVPTWIFHGAVDDVVPPGEDRLLAAAFRAAGATDLRHTEFPGVGHDSWVATYAHQPMWDWLFAQRVGD